MVNSENKTMFNVLNDFRKLIMEKILSNQELLKLVSISNDNPLSFEDIEDVQSLVNDCIWFKPKSFDTVENEKCFLITRMSVVPVYDKSEFASFRVNFYILVHNKLIDLYNDDNRAICICDCIHRMFHEAEGNWLGKISFNGYKQIVAPYSYDGMSLSYELTQFKW